MGFDLITNITLVSYDTIDGLTLHGALIKSNKKNKTIIIHEHGMGSSFYIGSSVNALINLAKKGEIDLFSTNNRGTGIITKFFKKNKKILAGTAHEKFKESIYDIDAAIKLVKKLGYKKIILSGHSTGCQKITYYQSIKKYNFIKGLILLAPADDYSTNKKILGKNFKKAITLAKKMVEKGKGNEIMTKYVSHSANRFLSYAKKGMIEAELFNYEGNLKLFSTIKTPILAIFGSKEEYVYKKSPKQMLDTLKEFTNSNLFMSAVIKDATHNFTNKEKELEETITNFVTLLKQK